MVTFIFVTEQLHNIMRRDVFQAIADPTRRDIIDLISNESMNLNSVAENFEISRPAISKHIKILEECGLVEITQRGRERYCKPKLEQLSEVIDWVGQYKVIWEHRFDSLENYIKDIQSKKQ